MTHFSTITSKRQLTLPAKVFKEAGLKQGQKVAVTWRDGELIITPLTDLVERLAGSLPTPKAWRGKDPDRIIDIAKKKHFRGRT